MSKIFDRFLFLLTPALWPKLSRRAFVVLLPVGVLYLIVGWVLLIAVAAVAIVAFAVFYCLIMAIGVPSLWCGQQVYRLWNGSNP